MPLPSLHPLPNNPTTGQAPLAGLRAGPPPASAAGGGGVSRETLKGLQDVYWSDDEVRDPSIPVLGHLKHDACHALLALSVPMHACDYRARLIQQDDPDCLLCAEPLDLSDLNFKPCQCGMQVSGGLSMTRTPWPGRASSRYTVVLTTDMSILLQQAAHVRLAMSRLQKTVRCESGRLQACGRGRVSRAVALMHYGS
jgi:hypothetical protein